MSPTALPGWRLIVHGYIKMVTVQIHIRKIHEGLLHMKRVSSCEGTLGIITVGFGCPYMLLGICWWPAQMD